MSKKQKLEKFSQEWYAAKKKGREALDAKLRKRSQG